MILTDVSMLGAGDATTVASIRASIGRTYMTRGEGDKVPVERRCVDARPVYAADGVTIVGFERDYEIPD